MYGGKPKQVPEVGFYYHYKHDAVRGIRDYAYEVLGVGMQTEEHAPEEFFYEVVYRPLYDDSLIYKAGKFFDLRPLAMWMGEVTVDGIAKPRFTRITDQDQIKDLELARMEMYGIEIAK